jgi:hypothetical protein
MSFFRKLFSKSSDEWVYIGSDEYITDYYNRTSVKILRELSLIQVDCQRVYTKKGKKILCDSWETLNLNNDEKNDIDHSYTGYMFDYNNRKVSLLSITYVSRSDQVLGGWIFQTDEIKPGTLDEKVLKKYVYNPSGFNMNIKPGTIYEVIFNKLIKDYNIQR